MQLVLTEYIIDKIKEEQKEIELGNKVFDENLATKQMWALNNAMKLILSANVTLDEIENGYMSNIEDLSLYNNIFLIMKKVILVTLVLIFTNTVKAFEFDLNDINTEELEKFGKKCIKIYEDTKLKIKNGIVKLDLEKLGK